MNHSYMNYVFIGNSYLVNFLVNPYSKWNIQKHNCMINEIKYCKAPVFTTCYELDLILYIYIYNSRLVGRLLIKN